MRSEERFTNIEVHFQIIEERIQIEAEQFHLNRQEIVPPEVDTQCFYHLYENSCQFKQRVFLSKSFFNKLLKDNFSHLKLYKSAKSVCHVCESSRGKRKKKGISTDQKNAIQTSENDHFLMLKEMKHHFIETSKYPEMDVEFGRLSHKECHH